MAILLLNSFSYVSTSFSNSSVSTFYDLTPTTANLILLFYELSASIDLYILRRTELDLFKPTKISSASKG